MNIYLPLIISNILVLILAIFEGWNIAYLLWSYWFQSVIIGVFHFITILGLKDFTTTGLTFNGRSVQPNNSTKKSVAYFFLMHYGFFHLVYAIFLFVLPALLRKNTHSSPFTFLFGNGRKLFFLSVLIFLAGHLYDFIQQRNKMKKGVNLGTLLFFPYARIVPMHLCIILAFVLNSPNNHVNFKVTPQIFLVLFMLLKTLADVLMQYVENNKLRNL